MISHRTRHGWAPEASVWCLDRTSIRIISSLTACLLGRLTYVDMTPRVKEDRPPPEPSIEGTIESTGMDKDGAPVARYQSDLEHCRVMDCKQNHHHTPREAESSRQVDAEPLNNPASADSTQLEGIIGHEGIHHQAGLSERSRYPQGPLHGFPDTNSDTAYLNWEEACLIRHFAENLAQWVRLPASYLSTTDWNSLRLVIAIVTSLCLSPSERCSAQCYAMLSSQHPPDI